MTEKEMMALFSRRLEALLISHEMKQTDLAVILGVSKSAVGKWLLQKSMPRMGIIQKLSDHFNVGKSYFLEENPPGMKKGKEAPDFDPSTLPSYIPIEKKKIPLIGTIAAGQPIEAIEHVEEWLPIDDDIRADFALRVSGDSMINADIEDGDIVFIRQQPEVMDGQIAAVLIDDDATLKRFYRIEGGVQLVAENPKYRPMIFTEENCDTLRILGLAVAKLSRFKY